MKFNCNLSALLAELTLAQEVIASKNTISIFSSIMLRAQGNNSLIIQSTDIRIFFHSTIACEILEEGEVLVFCGKLMNLLRSLGDGEIAFRVKDKKLEIRPNGKKIKADINILPTDKFPAIPEIEDSQYFELSQQVLLNMINNTIFAVSDDESRFFLTGVYFEKNDDNLVMVATDAKRLSLYNYAEAQMMNFAGVIVPPKVLSMLSRIAVGEGKLLIAVNDKRIFFKIQNHQISSSLIEGRFPSYEKIIPQEQEYRVELKRSSFLESVKRVAIMAEQNSRSIHFNFSTNKLILKSDTTEYGIVEEELDCEYSGADINFTISSNYIIDPIRVMSKEYISLEFSKLNTPLTLKSEQENDYFHIFMSMHAEA